MSALITPCVTGSIRAAARMVVGAVPGGRCGSGVRERSTHVQLCHTK